MISEIISRYGPIGRFSFRLGKWKNHDVVMKEGDKAEHVYYIVHGELNVIKDHGMPSQKSLTVIGRGEWWAQPPRPLSPVLLTLCLSAASATGAW